MPASPPVRRGRAARHRQRVGESDLRASSQLLLDQVATPPRVNSAGRQAPAASARARTGGPCRRGRKTRSAPRRSDDACSAVAALQADHRAGLQHLGAAVGAREVGRQLELFDELRRSQRARGVRRAEVEAQRGRTWSGPWCRADAPSPARSRSVTVVSPSTSRPALTLRRRVRRRSRRPSPATIPVVSRPRAPGRSPVAAFVERVDGQRARRSPWTTERALSIAAVTGNASVLEPAARGRRAGCAPLRPDRRQDPAQLRSTRCRGDRAPAAGSRGRSRFEVGEPRGVVSSGSRRARASSSSTPGNPAAPKAIARPSFDRGSIGRAPTLPLADNASTSWRVIVEAAGPGSATISAASRRCSEAQRDRAKATSASPRRLGRSFGAPGARAAGSVQRPAQVGDGALGRSLCGRRCRRPRRAPRTAPGQVPARQEQNVGGDLLGGCAAALRSNVAARAWAVERAASRDVVVHRTCGPVGARSGVSARGRRSTPRQDRRRSRRTRLEVDTRHLRPPPRGLGPVDRGPLRPYRTSIGSRVEPPRSGDRAAGDPLPVPRVATIESVDRLVDLVVEVRRAAR